MLRTLLPLLVAILVSAMLWRPAPGPEAGSAEDPSWLLQPEVPVRPVETSLALVRPLQGRISLTQGCLPTGGVQELHLVAEVAGREGASVPRRPPLNLVLVLDRSGSMRAESKWKRALEAAGEVVAALRPEDVLGLVTYSTDAQVVLPSGPVGDGSGARQVLGGLRVGGSTNISQALELALVEAARFRSRERLTRIVLLSDGKANHGLVEASELADLASGIRARGVSLTSLGMGLSYDEEVLQEMARLGGGNYAFLEHAGDASRAFRGEVQGLARLAVRGATLDVTPSPGVELTPAEGYPSSRLPDGTLRVRIGEISRSEVRKAVVQVRVPGGEEGQRRELVRVRLSYQALGDAWQEGGQGASFQVRFSGSPATQAASRVQAALARLEEIRASRLLDRVARDLARGKLAEGRRQLRDYATQAEERNQKFYQDRHLGETLRQVQSLSRDLDQVEASEPGARWVKRSRAQAFTLAR